MLERGETLDRTVSSVTQRGEEGGPAGVSCVVSAATRGQAEGEEILKKVVLLGQQTTRPTVSGVIDSLRPSGRVACVTAGWQEYEDEDQSLQDQLHGALVNLRLHNRGEDVFRSDTELARAYRARQERLRHYQDIYRVRLEYALEADRVISRRHDDPRLLAEERLTSMEAIRELDRTHLARCRDLHAEFDARWNPGSRDSVRKHREELAVLMADCEVLLIAGGHVAVLLNRLKLFGVDAFVGNRFLIAWSAGAMAIGERVILFHDSPPHGAGIAEILDTGMGLCRGVVPFSNPKLRLRLDDQERVSMYARRFAPDACVILDEGSSLSLDDGGWGDAPSVFRMGPEGELLTVEGSIGT